MLQDVFVCSKYNLWLTGIAIKRHTIILSTHGKRDKKKMCPFTNRNELLGSAIQIGPSRHSKMFHTELAIKSLVLRARARCPCAWICTSVAEHLLLCRHCGYFYAVHIFVQALARIFPSWYISINALKMLGCFFFLLTHIESEIRSIYL